MTAADLHPEEMLDGARARSLTSEASLDLGAHLQRCSACDLHLQVRQDLIFEGRPDRGDRLLSMRLVAAAVAGLDSGMTQRPSSGRRVGASSLLRRWMLPAACVLLGGGVATAMLSGPSDVDTTVMEALAPSPPVSPLQVRPVVRNVSQPIKVQQEAAGPPRPQVTSVLRRTRPVERARSTAGLMFREANRRRRAGDDAGALLLYGQLKREFPGSREAITAQIIVGQLELGSGPIAEALFEFESYLQVSPSGTLAEEARVGRALALERLSRPDEERRAWLDLVRRHPSSIHVERAQARLRQLQQ
jgi:hypothetical protein